MLLFLRLRAFFLAWTASAFVVVPSHSARRSPRALGGALSAATVDGSASADAPWDRDAHLAGYQNAAEIDAFEVVCADLPRDLAGTYYRNGHGRLVGYDGAKVRHNRGRRCLE